MKKIFTVLAVLVPSVAFGQTIITDATSLTTKLTSLGNVFIGILIALSVIFIIWHAVMFIINAAAPEERNKHGVGILWGIAGLAIILSIWGLVAILTNTFRTDNRTPTERFPVIVPVR
jgi:hypothetical protein